MRQHDSKAASAEEKGWEGALTCTTSAAVTQLASCHSIAQSFAATQAIKRFEIRHDLANSACLTGANIMFAIVMHRGALLTNTFTFTVSA